jgi:hypothetical protein
MEICEAITAVTPAEPFASRIPDQIPTRAIG